MKFSLTVSGNTREELYEALDEWMEGKDEEGDEPSNIIPINGEKPKRVRRTKAQIAADEAAAKLAAAAGAGAPAGPSPAGPPPTLPPPAGAPRMAIQACEYHATILDKSRFTLVPAGAQWCHGCQNAIATSQGQPPPAPFALSAFLTAANPASAAQPMAPAQVIHPPVVHAPVVAPIDPTIRPGGSAMTLDVAQKTLLELIKHTSPEKALSVLNSEFGVAKVSEMPPERWASFVQRCQQLAPQMLQTAAPSAAGML